MASWPNETRRKGLNPERWERLKQLFHSALEQEPGRRTEFLRKPVPATSLCGQKSTQCWRATLNPRISWSRQPCRLRPRCWQGTLRMTVPIPPMVLPLREADCRPRIPHLPGDRHGGWFSLPPSSWPIAFCVVIACSWDRRDLISDSGGKETDRSFPLCPRVLLPIAPASKPEISCFPWTASPSGVAIGHGSIRI